MSRFLLKIAVCVASFASSSLFADADAAELGLYIATDTVIGLKLVIQNDNLYASRLQSALAEQVRAAKSLKSANQRKRFLEAGINALYGISFSEEVGFDHYQVLEATFIKFVGIEILQKTYNRLSTISGCPQQALFSRLPFDSREESFRAFARAAINACQAVGEPCPYSVNRIVGYVYDYARLSSYEQHCDIGRPVPAQIVIDLIFGQFGDKVAEFLIGARVFDQAD